jgi:thiol-disulfide isomerase/thioredoxin
MSARRFASILVAGLLACAPIPIVASAATFPEEMPFSQSAFDAAQKAGEPVLVHITASWCTTCAAQKPIIDKLLGEPKFKDLKTFNIDFDSQKTLVHEFGARMQSTLIVFKGGKEEGRSSGETQPGPIESLLDKAV